MSLLKRSACTVFLLLLSWFIPATSHIWDTIDSVVFYTLNPLVESAPYCIRFINSHWLDWISDIVIILFLARLYKKTDPNHRLNLLGEFIYSCLTAVVVIALVNKQIMPHLLSITRKSPSLFLDGAVRLSHFFPGVKDASHQSFPGDHATTALFFILSYLHWTSLKRAIPAICYGVFMILPRIIIGAHWVTDVVMGSFVISLCGFAIAFGTPLKAYFVRTITRLLKGASTYYARNTNTL